MIFFHRKNFPSSSSLFLLKFLFTILIVSIKRKVINDNTLKFYNRHGRDCSYLRAITFSILFKVVRFYIWHEYMFMVQLLHTFQDSNLGGKDITKDCRTVSIFIIQKPICCFT